jgi:hypothetical protein
MGDLFLLSERQRARISPYFPLAHGVHAWTTGGWSAGLENRHPNTGTIIMQPRASLPERK